jgi:hypothetical protein
MLQSTNKQANFLTTENHRLRKKIERIESRYAKRRNNQNITCSRELKKHDNQSNKRSHGDLHDANFYGLNRLNNTNEDSYSPRLKPNKIKSSKSKLIYRNPDSLPMDQIVIINNHEYIDKLHQPTYKVKKSKSPKRIPNLDNINSKREKDISLCSYILYFSIKSSFLTYYLGRINNSGKDILQ